SLRLTLTEPAPAEAPVGAHIVVRVEVACADGIDRRDMMLKVTAPDGAITTYTIAHHEGAAGQAFDITLAVPAQVGEHVWRVRLPAHDDMLSIVICAVPHTTSFAVWAIPEPATAGERFTVKVGAKSSGDCALAGRRIEVRDAAGALVATGC